MSDLSIREQIARDYLAVELEEDAPKELTPIADFDEQPLEGEGAVTVFAFTTRLAGNPPEEFYVVSGKTTANYYPAWGLTPEQIYNVHVGTRFMLVVGVEQLALSEVPAGLETDITRVLAEVARDAPVKEFRCVAAFKADTHHHFICRVSINDEQVYVVGGELPVGIYREAHLPPHVIYRWHLGQIIRMERDDSPP